MKASNIKIGTVYAIQWHRKSKPEPYKVVGRDEINGEWVIEKTLVSQTGPLRTSVPSLCIIETWEAHEQEAAYAAGQHATQSTGE